MDNIKKLTLLHSNDLHGDFLAEEIDKKLIGGASMLSGYVNKVRKEEKNVLYAISGDMFRGSIIDSEYKGISTIDIMNMISPDVVTLGNHELDYGISHLLFLEKCTKFPVVNANIFITMNHSRLFQPYANIDINGLKVMFIGIITEEILAQTKTEELIGTFIDVREAAKEIGVICDNYRNSKTDLTVILSHIGYEKDMELATLLDPNWGVNIIIGGHTHTYLEEPTYVNNIPIVQVGQGTDQIGRFDIEIDTDTKQIVSQKWQMIPINEDTCPRDELLEELITDYKSVTDKKYGRILTKLNRALTHPSRIQETELGNLFADLLQVDSSFDIMLYGSGSIRKETWGPVIGYQDFLEISPFDGPLYMLEVTGEQFRRMITYVMRDEAWLGHTEFYQVSKGVKIVYSKSEKQLKELSLNGKEITPDMKLKIGLQDYHFNSFDEFFNVPLEEVAKNRRPRVVSTSCNAIFEELLTNSNLLDSHIEGRITILD